MCVHKHTYTHFVILSSDYVHLQMKSYLFVLGHIYLTSIWNFRVSGYIPLIYSSSMLLFMLFPVTEIPFPLCSHVHVEPIRQFVSHNQFYLLTILCIYFVFYYRIQKNGTKQEYQHIDIYWWIVTFNVYILVREQGIHFFLYHYYYF